MCYVYVKGVRLAAMGCFRARQASVTKNAEAAQQALRAVDDLQQYRAEVVQMLGEKYYPHYVYRMFDVDYLASLSRDIHRICSPLTTTHKS
jgi:hypothetical protein